MIFWGAIPPRLSSLRIFPLVLKQNNPKQKNIYMTICQDKNSFIFWKNWEYLILSCDSPQKRGFKEYCQR